MSLWHCRAPREPAPYKRTEQGEVWAHRRALQQPHVLSKGKTSRVCHCLGVVAVFTPQNRNVRCAELGGTAQGDCRKLLMAVKILLLGSAFSSRNVGENSTSVGLQLPSLQRKEQFVPCASPPASLQRGKQRSGDVPGKKWTFKFPVRSGINHTTSQEAMGFKQYLLIS